MGTNRFKIKTFESFLTPVVEFKKRVYDSSGDILQISPGKNNSLERGENSFSIDIHEINQKDDSKINIRNLTEQITIELIPDWCNKKTFENNLPNILNKGENPEETLELIIRLVCPKINFVIESKRIKIFDISLNKPIRFAPFELDDIIGKVEVQSELIRVKNSNPTNPIIAFAGFTILSKNRSISFYIDEIDDIGRNALSIIPGETKDKMFIMKNSKELSTEPPKLIYNNQFEEFFNNGDEYLTVQAIMIMVGLPYCEQILKWIIFGTPDYEKKEHITLIKFIGELCDKKESELKLITTETNNDEKIQEYLDLSNSIFDNIQNLGSGWKKSLYQIIKDEK